MNRWVLLGVLGVAACVATQPQRPFVFTTYETEDGPANKVAGELVKNGHAAKVIDAKSGLVATAWQDTGTRSGFVQGKSATVVRRFTATLVKDGSDFNVTLRIDVKRCARGAFTITDADLKGTCETMDGIVEGHQEELDSLGAKLRAKLSR